MNEQEMVIALAEKQKLLHPGQVFYVVKLQGGCIEIMDCITEVKKESLDKNKFKYKLIKTI